MHTTSLNTPFPTCRVGALHFSYSSCVVPFQGRDLEALKPELSTKDFLPLRIKIVRTLWDWHLSFPIQKQICSRSVLISSSVLDYASVTAARVQSYECKLNTKRKPFILFNSCLQHVYPEFYNQLPVLNYFLSTSQKLHATPSWRGWHHRILFKLVQVSTCDQKSYLLEHTPFPAIPHIPSPPTPPQQWAITSQEM